MNKLISVIRAAVLMTLGTCAIWLLFGEETDQNLSAWTTRFIIDKALAFCIFYATTRLYKRWSKTDAWFITFEKWCREAEDAPNPMRLNDRPAKRS